MREGCMQSCERRMRFLACIVSSPTDPLADLQDEMS